MKCLPYPKDSNLLEDVQFIIEERKRKSMHARSDMEREEVYNRSSSGGRQRVGESSGLLQCRSCNQYCYFAHVKCTSCEDILCLSHGNEACSCLSESAKVIQERITLSTLTSTLLLVLERAGKIKEWTEKIYSLFPTIVKKFSSSLTLDGTSTSDEPLLGQRKIDKILTIEEAGKL